MLLETRVHGLHSCRWYYESIIFQILVVVGFSSKNTLWNIMRDGLLRSSKVVDLGTIEIKPVCKLQLPLSDQ